MAASVHVVRSSSVGPSLLECTLVLSLKLDWNYTTNRHVEIAGPQEPEPVPQPAGAHHLQARPQLRRQRGPRRAAPPPLRCKKPFGAAALPPLDHERRESPQRNRRRRAESRLACRPRSPHPSARPRATTRPDARCSSANALSVPSPCRFPRPLPRGGRSSTPTTAAASTATSSAWPSASW